MTAKEQAVIDIKDELRQQCRCFLAFRERLNPVMDRLVDTYTKRQSTANKTLK